MTSQDQHKKEMQALKEAQRQKTAEAKDPGRGLILVLTGDGKGKSSSGFGMIIRALGWGQKVGVVQFIKGKWKTGEKQFFERLKDEVVWHTMGDGFTWETQNRDQDIAAATSAFHKAAEMMASGEFDLIILDEINIALRYDYLDLADVLSGLESRSRRTSVVLTGRDAKPDLCDYADLVSTIEETKHPFKNGIRAQRGIDF